MNRSKRSAQANDTKNVAVGDRSFPPRAHVAITTELPIIPTMNVIACVITIGRNAVQRK
jgi:hypothetical protein